MKCPRCGTRWSDNSMFCGNCGARFPKKTVGNIIKALLLSIMFVLVMRFVQEGVTAAHAFPRLNKDQEFINAQREYLAALNEVEEASAALETAEDKTAAEKNLEEATARMEAATTLYQDASTKAMLPTFSHSSLLLLIANLITLLLICLMFRLRRYQPVKVLNFRMCNPARIGTFILFGISLALSINILFILVKFPQEMLDSYDSMMELLSGESDSLLIQMLATVIAAPLIEEIIFRALSMRFLRPAVGKKTAVILSSLLFAFAHFSQGYSGSLIQVLYAFILGLILALLYDKYDSIIPSLVCHAAFNLMSFIPLEFSSPYVFLAVVGVGAATAVLCAYLIFARYPTFSDVVFDADVIEPINEKERLLMAKIKEMKKSSEPVSRFEIDAVAAEWKKNRKNTSVKKHNTTRSGKSDNTPEE